VGWSKHKLLCDWTDKYVPWTILRITLFYHGKKGNIYRLRWSNSPATSLHYMFRLGHNSVNINMKCFRQCSCGSNETL